MSRRSRKRMAPEAMAGGAAAGAAAGVAAAWLMNVFISKAGSKLTASLESQQERARQQQQSQSSEDDDATMKAADRIVETATGGRHLSHEGKEKGGPVVHYAFGALMGGAYGALAAYWPSATLGFGTLFGAVLYAAGDLVAVPALQLGPSATEEPLAKQATPFAAHLVYGATTDLLRRAILAAA